MRFSDNGRMAYEELFGREGFSGPSSLIYHRNLPEGAKDVSEGPADLMTPEHEQVHTNAHLKRGLDQQKIFKDEGVDLGRVVIGHSGDSTDIGYLEELISSGSYIGMDRFGLHFGELPGFEDRVSTVVKMCERGYANRMVISHDAGCIFDWFPQDLLLTVPQWNFNHIVDDVIPELKRRGVTPEQIDQMAVGNPRALFEKQGGY